MHCTGGRRTRYGVFRRARKAGYVESTRPV